jgi:putative ATPase
VVTYLASAPKSNRSYMGLKKAQAWVESTGASPVPLYLRSSDTAATAEIKPQDVGVLGQKSDYQYPHDYPRHFVAQNYFPAGAVPPTPFYEPDGIGFEKSIREFQAWLRQNTR